jgi:hypothetical protein
VLHGVTAEALLRDGYGVTVDTPTTAGGTLGRLRTAKLGPCSAGGRPLNNVNIIWILGALAVIIGVLSFLVHR